MHHPLLDKAHLRQQAYRVQRTSSDHSPVDFLLRWAEQDMSERLADIKRTFPDAALFSPAPSDDFLDCLRRRCDRIGIYNNNALTDEERFPCAPQSQDLIVSFFDLHKLNDLPGWLIQNRRALKQGGAFLACYAGENTLFQLRQSLLAAEIHVSGGACPRVMPFVTKQQMAGLLQRAGFSLPVVDSGSVTALYKDIYQLMHDLRAMGEANALAERHKSFTPSRLFFETQTIYQKRFADQDSRLPATFDTGFVIGWN